MTLRIARPAARPSPLWSFALALVVLAGGIGAALRAGATVYTSFDFESASYGAFGHRMSDHMLLKVGSTWHLFYTELAGGAVPVTRIGHATSTDLGHWTERPTVITAGGAPWYQKGTWAPQVTAAPGGGWVLLFAGKSDLGSESIGAMTSSDLDNWQLAPENPAYTPPLNSWARWGPDFYCSCRDPFVYYENGIYNMLYTAQTASSPNRPALGRAMSIDLLHWADAGPFAIDSISTSYADIESPSLVFRSNRVELQFTRNHAQMLMAPSSAGPWDFSQMLDMDARGAAAEFAFDGAVNLFSRVRYDVCRPPTAVIVIDTVTATPTGYAPIPLPTLPGSWVVDGDAFLAQPVYSDGPMLRGDTPAAPEGLRWLGTGETVRQPGQPFDCAAAEDPSPTGTVRSPRFTLQGDVLAFRISGKASSDSEYVALLDDCTGEELARTTGPGTSALTPFSWSNTGRRGWAVRLKLADLDPGPGGVIGLDAVKDSAVGTPAQPTPPVIDETAPAGGENLTPGTTYTIRWTGSSTAGVDSFCVYVSYDNFATPPVKLARRSPSQLSYDWTVPAGPKYTVKIRVVIFAKNAVHSCDESGFFTIGVTTGVGDAPPAAPGLSLAARAQPGPAPVLEWSAPAGIRATLAIYDVRGRLVRLLFDGPGNGPAHTPWDGRGDDGRTTPSGIYFARLVSASRQATTHLVRLAR